MIQQLGAPAITGPLWLVTREDFELTARLKDREFTGTESLTLTIEDTDYPFVIVGDTATLKIESEVADLIEAQTPFWLRYRDTATTPTTDKVRFMGNVRRSEPK